VGGTLFFVASDGTQDTLWKSDGTAGGTEVVPDAGSSLYDLTVVNGTLYYTAFNGVGLTLWRSDGTAEGTGVVPTVGSWPGQLAPTDLTESAGMLYYAANGELWRYDGGDAPVVVDIDTAYTPWPTELTDVNGTLYFTTYDDMHGHELWKVDAGGASFVADIFPGVGSSAPQHFTNVDGTLYVFADDGTHGRELWKSDGTASGTVMVADISPTGGSWPYQLTDVNGTLYFVADGKVWRSDGTAAGTEIVADINPNDASGVGVIGVNGTLYFTADDGTHGEELWKVDAGGAALVEDINPAGSSSPRRLADVGGSLYFSADDGTHGRELWTSDGTPAGTHVVADINPSGDSSPEGMALVAHGLLPGERRRARIRALEARRGRDHDDAGVVGQSGGGGGQVTLTASVGAPPADGMPEGTVTFGVDGVARAPVALSGGTASVSVALAPGRHTVTAAFTGGAGFADSAAQPLVQTVAAAPAVDGDTTRPGAGPAGGGAPAPAPSDATAPALSDVSLSASVFAVDARGGAAAVAAVRGGTTLRYRLSEAARVRVTVKRVRGGRRVGGRCVRATRSNRGARRCVRLRRVGRLAIDSRAGANARRFSGRIGGRSLAVGRYRASLVAIDAAGNRSARARLGFRVVGG
jgi:ELWxxDGT repeat protein